MARYFIEMAYKGSNYHGWQIQPNAITVQEVLKKQLSLLLQDTIQATGAGRTDTGVHAKYFVAHFDSEKMIADKAVFLRKINGLLPKDIVIYSVAEVANDVHSRFQAISRTYKYYLASQKSPFKEGLIYVTNFNFDFEKMNEAAKLLFNFTDFTSFSKLHTDVKTNNCIVKKANWTFENGEWVFTIEADRFLRNMVRAIVGTLLLVGRGKLSVEEFENVIKAKNRSLAGSSAAAEGLYLTNITYPDELFKPTYMKY